MTVWLVGAGPGDPDLLTVRAGACSASADVVVHDALVGDGVLELVPAGVELIDVGKRLGPAPPGDDLHAARRARPGQGPSRTSEGRRSVRVRPRRRGGRRSWRPASVRGRARHHARAAAPGRGRHPGHPPRRRRRVHRRHRPPRRGEPDVDWRALARVGGTIVILDGGAPTWRIAGRADRRWADPPHAVAAVRRGYDRRAGWSVGAARGAWRRRRIESPAVIGVDPVARRCRSQVRAPGDGVGSRVVSAHGRQHHCDRRPRDQRVLETEANTDHPS